MEQKKNWIEELERELRQLPEDDRLDIIMNYKEQITAMLEEGKSETDILQRLGSPKEVAKEAKQALGYEPGFEFNQEKLFENVKQGANTTINQVTDLLDRQLGDSKASEKIWYLLLLVVLGFSAIVVGSVAFGLIVGGISLFFVSFLFIHLTWSLFFLCLSLGWLLLNSGLALCYAIYKMARYLILKLT